MLTQFFPFQFEISPVAIATSSIWAAALYVGVSPVSEWIAVQISRWFGYAERSLYLSEEEYERTRKGREAQNAFWASVFSIIPFLILGALCDFACLKGLGNQSWGLSLGIIALMGCGVYDLGRRDGEVRK
ncbi:MAG: hypothetical protein ACFCU8_19330 [Thermosynechococcaceae cyanobacterium]